MRSGAHRAYTACVETASLLAVVLPPARFRNLPPIQAHLVDSRPANHPSASVEHESPFLARVLDWSHRVSRRGLDDRLTHRPRRSNSGSHRITGTALLHRHSLLQPPDHRRGPMLG